MLLSNHLDSWLMYTNDSTSRCSIGPLFGILNRSSACGTARLPISAFLPYTREYFTCIYCLFSWRSEAHDIMQKRVRIALWVRSAARGLDSIYSRGKSCSYSHYSSAREIAETDSWTGGAGICQSAQRKSVENSHSSVSIPTSPPN